MREESLSIVTKRQSHGGDERHEPTDLRGGARRPCSRPGPIGPRFRAGAPTWTSPRTPSPGASGSATTGGPQYIADAWINEVKGLGITISPSYGGEPECHGVIARVMGTLREQCLYLHRF
jgi:hypothetical protein